MKLSAIFACVCIITTAVLCDEIKVYYDDPATKTLLYVETDLIKVGVAANQGKITEWYVKTLDKNIAFVQPFGEGILAQRFAIFDVGKFGPLWPEGWPTPIATGDYETEVMAINGGKAVIQQTYTVPASSMFSGLRVEKTYTIQTKKYEIEVTYVITNMSAEVKSFTYNGVEYGINLAVETSMRGGDPSHLAYKSQGAVFSSVLPTLPFHDTYYLTPMRTQWCAVANVEGGYVLGSKFVPATTHGLWPGERKPGGAPVAEGYDFEAIFRSVVYQPGQSERCRFIVYGGPGSIETFSNLDLGKEVAPGSSDRVTIPSEYGLDQNYPNPFNPSTTIRYGLPTRSHVTLTVFNMVGQQVATLVQGEQEAGFHVAEFDASGMASGVYLYRLQAGDFVQTKRLLLLK